MNRITDPLPYIRSSPKRFLRQTPATGHELATALAGDALLLTDAPTILDILSHTSPGEPSAKPSAPETLRDGLKKLRRAALDSIPERTANVTVDLVCWMELRL